MIRSMVLSWELFDEYTYYEMLGLTQSEPTFLELHEDIILDFAADKGDVLEFSSFIDLHYQEGEQFSGDRNELRLIDGDTDGATDLSITLRGTQELSSANALGVQGEFNTAADISLPEFPALDPSVQSEIMF